MSEEDIRKIEQQIARMQTSVEQMQHTMHEIHCAIYKGTDRRGGLVSRVSRLELGMYIVGTIAGVAAAAAIKVFIEGSL